MKKQVFGASMAKVFVAVAAISLFAGCADVTSDESEEETQKARAQDLRQSDSDSTGKASHTLQYATDIGKAPGDYTFSGSRALTADRVPILTAEEMAFNGWCTTINRKKTTIAPGFVANSDMQLSAQWKECKIGDIVTNNGAIITTDCFLKYKNDIKAAGIICRLANGTRKMLALGLKESSNDMYWMQDNIKVPAIESTVYISGKTEPTFQRDIDGVDNYDEIVKAGGNVSAQNNAFYYAKHYGESNQLSGTLADGWFIPTAEEMYYLIREYMTVQKSYTLIGSSEPLFDAISDQGRVSSIYWTSSYYDYFHPKDTYAFQYVFAINDKEYTEIKKVVPNLNAEPKDYYGYASKSGSFKSNGETINFAVIKTRRAHATARTVVLHEL